MFEANQAHFIEGTLGTKIDPRFPYLPRPSSSTEQHELIDEGNFEEVAPKKSLLTQVLPDPGFFAAGGLAGVISRTATAPLDRLKVYLIANVGKAKDTPIAAAKRGDAVAAAKHIGRPLTLALQELWKAGGMRSLFAGMITLTNPDYRANAYKEMV